MTAIRKCKPEEQQLIQDKYGKVKEVMDQNKRQEVYWAHIYLNGNYLIYTQEETK